LKLKELMGNCAGILGMCNEEHVKVNKEKMSEAININKEQELQSLK